VTILDTNVISELMRPEPHPAVLSWVGGQRPSVLHTTSVTQAEIFYGVAVLPAGKRRDALAAAADAVFAEDLAGRVLPFDGGAAERYAEIRAARRRAGTPMEAFDAQIAAIALTSDAVLATRDLGDFAGCGLTVVDPWRTA
jgi:predicted nucleic acid-binding protein